MPSLCCLPDYTNQNKSIYIHIYIYILWVFEPKMGFQDVVFQNDRKIGILWAENAESNEWSTAEKEKRS